MVEPCISLALSAGKLGAVEVVAEVDGLRSIIRSSDLPPIFGCLLHLAVVFVVLLCITTTTLTSCLPPSFLSLPPCHENILFTPRYSPFKL